MTRHAPGVHHVIVDMGGSPIHPGSETILDLGVDPHAPLPLAAARNAGVASTDADVVILLDVDCLAASGLVPAYASHVSRYGGVWSGPVSYLPPSQTIADWSEASLLDVGRCHAYRPVVGQTPSLAPSEEMFWSLSFAIGRETWDGLGGFDESFVGYGAEDTDFARSVAAAGIDLWFGGDAVAFHQYHPISSPPVEHLDDIVRNANLFHRKWGDWPMKGWLAQFHSDGLISWTDESVSRRLGEDR